MRVRSEGAQQRSKPRLKVGAEVVAVWRLHHLPPVHHPVARRGRVYSVVFPDGKSTVYRVLLDRAAHGAKLYDVPATHYEGSWEAHCRRYPWDRTIQIR